MLFQDESLGQEGGWGTWWLFELPLGVTWKINSMMKTRRMFITRYTTKDNKKSSNTALYYLQLITDGILRCPLLTSQGKDHRPYHTHSRTNQYYTSTSSTIVSRHVSVPPEHGNNRRRNDSTGSSTLQHSSRVIDSANRNNAVTYYIERCGTGVLLPSLEQ